MTLSVEDRLFTKVEVGDCWQWLAATDERGYGRFGYEGRNQRAHRVVWMILVGPLSKDVELDHLCRNHGCVNPDHLEPVTHHVNVLRGALGSSRRQAVRCSRNHPFDSRNTMIGKRRDGTTYRMCRECRNARRRKVG